MTGLPALTANLLAGLTLTLAPVPAGPKPDPLAALLANRPAAATPVARRPLSIYDSVAGLAETGLAKAGLAQAGLTQAGLTEAGRI